jgi:hypothetical protein
LVSQLKTAPFFTIMLFVAQAVDAGLNINIIQRRRPNIERHRAENYEPLMKRLRLNEEEFHTMVGEYHGWRSETTPGANVSISEKHLEVFLDLMAGGGYYRQVGHTIGVHKSSAFNYSRNVSNYFANIAQQHISLPQENVLAGMALPLQTVNSEIKHVVLFVDGFIVRTQRPDHSGDAYYCSRTVKFCDGILCHMRAIRLYYVMIYEDRCSIYYLPVINVASNFKCKGKMLVEGCVVV